jgi:hypothetical protein
MARVFINCREAHALLSGRCDGVLGWRQRLLLRVHLAGCDACSIVGRNLFQLSRAVRRLGQHTDTR